MLISELIALLQSAIETHGDVPIYLDDPDTGWCPEIKFDPVAKSLRENYPHLPQCASVTGSYHD